MCKDDEQITVQVLIRGDKLYPICDLNWLDQRAVRALTEFTKAYNEYGSEECKHG